MSFSSNSPSENIHARNIIQTGQVILRNICVSIYKNREKRGHKCEGDQKRVYEWVWREKGKKEMLYNYYYCEIKYYILKNKK